MTQSCELDKVAKLAKLILATERKLREEQRRTGALLPPIRSDWEEIVQTAKQGMKCKDGRVR
jgi:hypothetical protein